MKTRSRGRGYAGRKGRSGVDKLQAKAMKDMPTFTPQLLKLFVPRPPLPPPNTAPPPIKKHLPYTGLAQFVCNFADPGDPPSPSKAETPSQRRAHIHALRITQGAQKAAQDLENYDPHHDPSISGDPYKTLFVSNVNFDTTEHKLKREFEIYGPIKRVRLVHDTETGKPKGYAFIEYLHTRDMKAAYKTADRKKVDGRRVIVDVERGRTVSNWRPRRLGGGLGSTRLGIDHVNDKSGDFCPSIANRGHNEDASRRGHMEMEPSGTYRHNDGDKTRSKERNRDSHRYRGHMEMEPNRSSRCDDRSETHLKERNIGYDRYRYCHEHDQDRAYHGKRAQDDDCYQYDCVYGSRRTYDRDHNRYNHDMRHGDSREGRTYDRDGKHVHDDRHGHDNNPEFVRQSHPCTHCSRYHDGDMDMECVGQLHDDINEVQLNEMQL